MRSIWFQYSCSTKLWQKGMNNMDLESKANEKKLRLVIRPQHRTTLAPQHQSTVRSQHRPTTRPQHRSTLPLHRRSTLGAYQSRRSSMYVKILGMEIPLRDQTSLGGRRGGIGRRETWSNTVLRYHWFLNSQMVSRNPECAADASHSRLQRFEHSLVLRW